MRGAWRSGRRATWCDGDIALPARSPPLSFALLIVYFFLDGRRFVVAPTARIRLAAIIRNFTWLQNEQINCVYRPRESLLPDVLCN